MEDLFTQNHLATIGVVKDNPVRRFTIRTAVAAVGVTFQRLLLRGGFGGVFTLHFAHVVWLDEGRRILLLTGYDGSALSISATSPTRQVSISTALTATLTTILPADG